MANKHEDREAARRTKEEATDKERNCPPNRAVSEGELSAVARGGHRPQRSVKGVSGGTFQYNGLALRLSCTLSVRSGPQQPPDSLVPVVPGKPAARNSDK